MTGWWIMLLDPLEFRAAMRQWTTGVAIATSFADGFRHGMTVNSFTSITLTPPMVLVSLAKDTRTHALVEKSGVLAITILADHQEEISERFAGKLSELADRFSDVPTFTLVSRAPLIEGGIAFFDCQVKTKIDTGSTTIFLSEVVAVKVEADRKPLVYHNRTYFGLQL